MIDAGPELLADSFDRWVRPGDELDAGDGPLGTIASRFSAGE